MHEGSFRATARQHLDGWIQVGFQIADQHGVRDAYARLLHPVQTRSALLRSIPSTGKYDNRWLLIWGLYALALHHADWLRPPEAWSPPPGNAWPQFASLAAHLFALYPMPACMTSAWFTLGPELRCPEHEWYKHLGRGRSLRTANLPLRLTRAMAHHFTQAPAHYTIRAALRWAQVRGLGGREDLARAVAATRLGREFDNEDFWLTALGFFVRHPRLDAGLVGPMVDFLYETRFQTREVFVPGEGFVRRGPPRPDFSLRGRTPASLLRLVEEWHRELGLVSNGRLLAWPRSALGWFRLIEGSEQQANVRCWTIEELLTSRELYEEGRALRHCVASYADRCARGLTTIWSLRVDAGRGPRPVLTVEVDPQARVIRQARGQANRPAREAERLLLERWAACEGLQFAEQL